MTAVAAADIRHDLKPAPIEPSWVLAGAPAARNCVLFHASDKSAWTMLWDCTAGEFQWRYSFDETIHFLEGGVCITLPGGAPRRFGAGDVIFFPAGAVAHWKVDAYVRKLAFCQTPAPALVHLPLRLVRRVARHLAKIVPLVAGLLADPGLPDYEPVSPPPRPAYSQQQA